LLDGIAVIDYNAIFLGTDLARERIDDLRDSSDYKDLTDEAQSKDSERIKLAEKLKKDESTLSQSEQEEILKKIQTLYQSIQLLSQQIQAKEQEVTQKLQADQAESVQKVVNELIKAKKIKVEYFGKEFESFLKFLLVHFVKELTRLFLIFLRALFFRYLLIGLHQ
jgi:DNA anti-recombination protein RmuC